ncbi:furin-like isoform X2 [Biomphalaria glabrata]|uniref:Furin-like isoform X2 n=1 Tax=Biomphalaria glabrata TaxID=6526 RepID=A0A9W2YBN2_BIOGL|nr:furin-like isoform X2 [Biomphalaria glabrata]
MHGSIHVVKVLIFGIFLLLVESVVGKHFTDLWAVYIKGGEEMAKAVAARHGFIYVGQIMPDYYHFQHRKVAKRSTFASTHYHQPLAEDSDVLWVEQQVAKSRQKRNVAFNDPKWPLMWYLNRGSGLDMNVLKAWDMGYTGKGVVVTILDDGIEKDHPDLSRNYDPNASYDVNGHDPDPQPRYDYSNENRHGTRCAGEVAAHADNNVCGLGVAYNARIGGVRMLDGDVTDSVEAQSLGLNFDHIHIYSASWGPDDDGRTVDGPATLARKAFYDGITRGRKGLGSIYVWASGNGGRDSDNCNCDGYTNSIYTISISSATENGHIPWYSEACSSTLATTYSSGSGGEKQIVTTDLRKSCTETHTGTSGSAPLAAGIIALALEANPMLTWRDMQHIVVETAKADNLNAPDWAFNGVGKKVSHSFGFGLMDAAAMVSLARNWTTVPAQHICEIRCSDHNSRIIPTNGKIFVPLTTDGCEHTVNHVKYLEHVQARITLSSYRRGEIRIFLSSPSNTRSTLLAKRTRDVSKEGFNNWAFMTTHNWGEPAKGQWTLEIENGASIARPVKLRDWVLVLYGTDSPPRKSPTSARSPHYDYGVHYNVNEPPRPVDRTKTTFTYDDPMYNTDEDEDYYQKTPAPLTTRPPTTTTTKSTTPFYQAYQGNRKQSVDSPHYPTHNPELKEWTLVMMGTSPHLTKRNGSTQSGSNNATSDGSFTCAGVTSNGICIECKPGYFKMGEHCVAHCPQHYFGSVQGSKSMLHSQGECKLCHDSCLNCKGSKPTDCFQCASGFERKGDVCEKKMIWDLLDPDVMKHLAWAIILCIAAILLFSVVFGILQARERGRLCWKNKPNYVPDWGKGHYDGVTPNLAMHDRDMEAEFSLPAKTHTLFSQAIGYKHQRCSNRPGQFV